MRPLIWKEWHEQRWKLGFGCVVLCAFAVIGLRTRIIPDESIIIATCALGVLMLPILSAAGLIPAERGQGTLQSLVALPVAPWRVLAGKTILGTFLCAGPLVAAAIVTLLITHGREVSALATIAIYLRSALVGLSLFAWMLSLTARSYNEGRAAALAIGVLVCWSIVTSGLLRSTQRGAFGNPDAHPQFLLWAACPFLFIYSPADVSLAAGLVVQLAIAAGLWLLAIRAMTAALVEAKS